jgi:hypothetical protein
MRAVTVVFAGGVALAAMSAQAAPLAPRLPGPAIYLANEEWAPLPSDPRDPGPRGAALAVELVAESNGSRTKIETPQSIALDCFIAAEGSAKLHNTRCAGRQKMSEAEATLRYLELSPADQVAADVAAETAGLGMSASVRQ